MSDQTIARRPPDELFVLVTDVCTAPFWEHAAQGRLAVPRCGNCSTFRMPPTPFCPNCLSQQIEWVELSGKGTIFSHSAVMRAVVTAMEGSIPYVVAVVELEGAQGCRLISNVVDAPLADIVIGAPVEVVFDSHESGVTIPRFTISKMKQ